jgi:hypothetical protein
VKKLNNPKLIIGEGSKDIYINAQPQLNEHQRIATSISTNGQSFLPNSNEPTPITHVLT